MLAVLLCILFYFFGQCFGFVQTPNITQCSGNNSVQLKDLNIRDACYGSNASGTFVLKISAALQSPQIHVEATVMGSRMPCTFGTVGSCTYDICRGTSPAEKFLSKPWNSSCPITPSDYRYEISFFINTFLQFLIEGHRINLTARVKDEGQDVGCSKFEIELRHKKIQA
uniref:Putative lipocalin-8 9 n=2 Tax=Ixodes ricinus TaxID=34613 RepID=V5H6C9_IXORI